jgi:hypothetical protein
MTKELRRAEGVTNALEKIQTDFDQVSDVQEDQ